MPGVSIRPGRGVSALLFSAALAASACWRPAPAAPAAPAAVIHPPELEYLEAVNRVGFPRDPQLLFLLMAAYANANRSGAGAEFFAARLAELGPRLNAGQRALYLGVTALLRAQHASEVSLISRIGYVNDTVTMLE